MLTVLGVLTYYVAPTAFLYKNYYLFFLILNILLILMILGLTFISLLSLPTLQKWTMNLLVWFSKKDQKLKHLINKNMDAHMKRSTKTALMFSLCLCFLIFAGGAFTLIGELIVSQLEVAVGADLYAVPLQNNLNSMLDEGKIVEFLAQQKAFDGAVEGWAFTSYRLGDFFNKITGEKRGRRTWLSDLSGHKETWSNIYSVQENHLDVGKEKYYLVNEVNQKMLAEMREAGE